MLVLLLLVLLLLVLVLFLCCVLTTVASPCSRVTHYSHSCISASSSLPSRLVRAAPLRWQVLFLVERNKRCYFSKRFCDCDFVLCTHQWIILAADESLIVSSLVALLFMLCRKLVDSGPSYARLLSWLSCWSFPHLSPEPWRNDAPRNLGPIC